MASPETRKVALITGITGQDGSYLCELLLSKEYSVHGIARRNSSPEGVNLENLKKVQDRIVLHKGDILDSHGLTKIVKDICPHEIYHLAAQSHVSQSFETAEYTMQVNTMGSLNLLQAIVTCGLEKHLRLYNASTSELFGGTLEPNSMLNEESPFVPKSPYGVSKLAAYWLVRNYRESHGIWAVNGLLFNHESARRGSGFVTTRIARGVANYVLGVYKRPLTLAGVHMARDWGHAQDYVRGIWMMLQQNEPLDMILATGTQHTVEQFVEASFQHVGIQLRWIHDSNNELTGALNVANGDEVVKLDQSLKRAAEVHCLLGDSSLARQTLGWRPNITFETLVGEVVDRELERLRKT